MKSGVQSNNDAKFGKYTLVAKLATGGMGEIFLAKLSGMAGFEKLVVIKRLLPHLAEDAHFVTMLLDEARIAARLSHPNVCQVHDLGEVDGQYYIAMEYLEGVPCSQMLKLARRHDEHLEIGLSCSILQQTCDGLHHAHELKDHTGKPIGLVHRDVSPSNLFATISGAIKVLDFGVAKSQDARARTHTGALKGKYAYMSPEQVMAHELDRRSDIFSLGIVLFELLCTRRLFWRDSEYKMFQAIAEDPIPDVRDFRPEVPAPLAAIVRRALSRDADKRFATAVDLSNAIGKVVTAMSVTGGNRKIAAYVSENFESAIRERRELLVTAVSAHQQPTVADGRADMGEHSQVVREDLMVAENPTPSNLSAVLNDLKPGDLTPKRKPVLLVAVLALLLVGGGVLGIGYVRGSSADTPPALDAGAVVTAPLDAGPNPEDVFDEGDSPIPVATGKKTPEDTDAGVKVVGASELLNRIRGGQACLRKATAKQPSFTLTLEIDADGRAERVRIKPRKARTDAVALCLGAAARRSQFEKKGGPYGGRINIAVKPK